MKIHEFQGKEILRQYGVAVPEGGVAHTPEEAEQRHQWAKKEHEQSHAPAPGSRCTAHATSPPSPMSGCDTPRKWLDAATGTGEVADQIS